MSVVNENAEYRHFEEMLESIPGGGMCVVGDLDFTVVFINDVLLSMLGYTRDEFYAATEGKFVKVIHPDDRQLVFAGAHKSITDGNYFFTYRVFGKNGEVVWLRESDKTTIAPDGRELVLCVFSDVTDEAHLREEISYTSRQLQTIVDSAAMLSVGEDFERSLINALERIRDYFSATRAYIFEFDWESNAVDETFQVCRAGEGAKVPELKALPLERIRFWFDAMVGDGNISISTNEIDESRTEEIALLRERGVENMLSVPLRADGRLMGFIGADNPQINEEDVSFLVILSYFIASELIKYRTQLRVRSSEAKLKELIKNAPGGLCHYKFSRGKMLPVTVSKGFAKMVGLSEEEELERIKKDPFAHVLEEDKPLLAEGLERLAKGENSFSVTYRLFNNLRQSYRWVKLDALAVPRSDGDLDVYANFADVDKEVKTRREAEERFKKVVDQIKTTNRNTISMNLTQNIIDLRNSVLVDEEWGFSAVSTPKALLEMLCGSTVHADDRERLSAFCYKALKKSYGEGEFEKSVELRLALKSGWRWTRVSVRLEISPGTTDLLGFFWAEDIHEEKLRLAIIERVAEVDYDYISLIDAEKNSYTMFAYNENRELLPATGSDDYEAEVIRSVETEVLPEDKEIARRNGMISRIKAQLEKDKTYCYTVRMKTGDGRVQVKNLQYVWIDKAEGLILSMSTDITAAVLEEQRTSEALGMLINAAGQSKMSVFTYDFETQSISFSEKSCDFHRLTDRGMLYPAKYVEQGFVHPDDKEIFMDMLRRVNEGQGVVSAEIRYLAVAGDLDSGHWERTIYSTVRDSDGKPVKAYGSSQDITEQKLMELRLEKEMTRLRRARTGKDYPAYIIFNATKDVLIEHEPGGFPVQTIPSGSSMEEGRRLASHTGISESDKSQFAECFDRELILSTFHDGGDQIIREYRRMGKEPGNIIWARTTVSIVQDPASADILCFCYTTDVSDERTREAVLDTMLSDEYEFVMYVDLKNDLFKTYANKYGGTLLPAGSGCYSSMISSFVKECYVPEDIEKTLQLTSPKGIRSQLKYAESFELVGSTIEEDGSKSIKKLRCGYIDKANEIVYCYRMDITDLFEKEREQKEAIAAALAIAEKANSAKSRFLTRMSRDMRTPMNEVLGLTRLSLERNDLTPEAREDIEQVAKSANFLHDIINDVLDLSKIESGEINLHYERVNMAELFEELIGSSAQLAGDAGVSFTADTRAAGFETVLLDKLRVWQIFSRLLSSAIRISQSGGEVAFSARRTAEQGDMLGYEFHLRDGAARSGSSLAVLLEGCLDEEREISDDFDAMGMAMPIVRSLIAQMGGSITAQSDSDGGSEITVCLSFRKGGAEENSQPREDYSLLSGKRVLLVEDHPTNVIVATKVLESRGIITETAENGQIAVSMFTKAQSGYYDAILMDVRMPVMNGLEATRRIRALDKPDAMSVPIIAMTANAFQEDIRASHDAGMTEHLSKPIEPRKLCDALCRCIKK